MGLVRRAKDMRSVAGASHMIQPVHPAKFMTEQRNNAFVLRRRHAGAVLAVLTVAEIPAGIALQGRLAAQPMALLVPVDVSLLVMGSLAGHLMDAEAHVAGLARRLVAGIQEPIILVYQVIKPLKAVRAPILRMRHMVLVAKME